MTKQDDHLIPYTIAGYDKDASITEPLAIARDERKAVTIAKALLYYHTHVEEVRRNQTGDPFDWFEVIHHDAHTIFTSEFPDGIDAELLNNNQEV